MNGFNLKSEISIGDILTIASIIISIVALLVSWNKDRQLKKKEYADKIRHTASVIIAKIERWTELSQRFFDDIQPLITDTDVLVSKEKDITSARDFLWRGLVAKHAEFLTRIVDEKIEISYVDLYGYDPKVQTLFSITTQQLKAIDDTIHIAVLNMTQNNVLRLNKDTKSPPISAQLGNELRKTCHALSLESKLLMNEVVKVFRDEMLKIIVANDTDIYNKKIKINSTNPIDMANKLRNIVLPQETDKQILVYSLDVALSAITSIEEMQK